VAAAFSGSQGHMAENVDVFDLEPIDDEMSPIAVGRWLRMTGAGITEHDDQRWPVRQWPPSWTGAGSRRAPVCRAAG
jgi:hypothetical protein